MLLALPSTIFLCSESQLLSQIWDFPFVASYDSQGPGGGIRPRLHTGNCENHMEQIICKDSVRTSQETHISAAKPNRLMLFRETVAVYCENHMEHTNTLCGHNAEFLLFKSRSTCTSSILPLCVKSVEVPIADCETTEEGIFLSFCEHVCSVDLPRVVSCFLNWIYGDQGHTCNRCPPVVLLIEMLRVLFTWPYSVIIQRSRSWKECMSLLLSYCLWHNGSYSVGSLRKS
jgi:hypothetical protein